MARSARLRQLEKRLTELRRHLIPAKLSPTGSYSPRVIDRARAYRLLAHAELEACVEDMVRDLAANEYKAWELDRKPRTCLLAMVSFYEHRFPEIPDVVPASLSKVTPGFMKDRIRKAWNAHMRNIAKNNGVKEQDLLRLLLPIGVQEYELDRTWLATMDSFGSRRGDVAHQSFRTQQPPDPASELATVGQIVAGLRQVDALITQLRAV
jgi:RiboL-PSP-HEPN